MWGQSQALSLVGMLTEFKQAEDITPDRFYEDVDTLRAAINSQTSPASKAIYQATLAHILTLNAYRANVHETLTESPSDSLREWSYQDYIRHAALLYKESLTDLEALHREPAKAWVPLVKRGKDEGIYAGDMLSVVWQVMTSDMSTRDREKYNLPTAASAAALYNSHGLREAALRTMLSSVDKYDRDKREKALTSIIQEYGDTEASVEAYLMLAQEYSSYTEEADSQRLAWLDEAERKWPKSKWANNIQNARRSLTYPMMKASIPMTCYPQSEAQLPISTRNISKVRVTIYALPDTFSTKQEDLLLKQVKKQGKGISHIDYSPTSGQNGTELQDDTITWQTPGCGVYALVLTAESKEKLKEKPAPQVGIVRVTRMAAYHTNMPNGQIRLTVVDAKSGEPQQGVSVAIHAEDDKDGKKKELPLLTTDREGCLQVRYPHKQTLHARIFRDGDAALTDIPLYNSTMRNIGLYQEDTEIAILTDRSIYRPGQKVRMSAVVYKKKDRSTQVAVGKEYEVTLIDNNGKKVMQHKRKTDNMGVLQDTISLPENGMPGWYTIKVGNRGQNISVEEYRRPTFKVELDCATTGSGKPDSVTVTGKATTYSGVPVSNARVTGYWRWADAWWRIDGTLEIKQDFDTIWTDQEGKFSLSIPVVGTEEQLRRGRSLETCVDVLSAQGETQQGTLRTPVCSTPLRMQGSMQELQCKEHLSPWIIKLYSSTDQEVKGHITCTLLQEGQEKKTFDLQAGISTIPQELQSIESGKYDLLARAEVNGDTASWRTSFELISMSDTYPHSDKKLYLYSPDGKFSPKKAAEVQLGSSLQNAWIRVMLTTKNGLAIDSLMHMSHELKVLSIPYKKEYGEGGYLKLYLYRDGHLEEESCLISLKRPDRKLNMKWESFRDHLRPGQDEEWCLSISTPDGKPATANLTASLYDASLDALDKHSLYIYVNDWYNFPGTASWMSTPAWTDFWRKHLTMQVKFRTPYGRKFSMFDPQYNLSAQTGMEGNMGRYTRGMLVGAKRKVSKKYSLSAEYFDVPDSAPMAADAGIQGMGRSEFVGKAQDGQLDFDEQPVATNSLRTNLQETAFYMPQLRTDAQGQVKICFTLPESMTSWHLLGVAHTADMMVGQLDTIVVATKELMAETLLPRFLRSGDQAALTASIRNRSEQAQQGKATLYICDAETDKVLMRKTVNFQLEAKQETTFTFPYTGSMEHPALTVKWVAEGKDYSDGEQRYLPVLSDMQSMTETKAFSLSGTGSHSIALDKLFAHDSQEATARSLTIEYTRDPKWLAIQTLPSMVMPTRKDALSLSSAFYASALAYGIEQKFPQVAQAIKEWSTQDGKALESPLTRNEELTGVLMQETPWVLEAENERTRRQRLATLFDDVEQEDYRMNLLSALKKQQKADGSFSWYPGMRGSAYITQSIVEQLARLCAMTGSELPMQREMRERGCKFLLQEMAREQKETRKADKYVVQTSNLRTLYALRLSGYDSQMTTEERKAVQHELDLLRKQAPETDREERALAAVVLHLYGEQKQAASLMERLHTLIKQPDGTHLAYVNNGRTSIDSKTSEHVQLMEAIRMVEPQDTATLCAMQEWLIGMKRTQEWDNTTQTADAVYALLSSGADFSQGADRLTLHTSSKPISISSPKTTLGYVRERVSVSTTPSRLVVEKKSQALSYGAVYAQYQIPAQKAEAQQEGLNIRRDITGVEHLRRGDRVHVRYTLTASRDYEFVRLLAPRPAAAEPSAQRSGYEFASPIGYYKAIHDASTEYFFDQLPQGTYVIEEDWLISRQGSYTLPSALLQCLYAPDYQAHTVGTTVEVR